MNEESTFLSISVDPDNRWVKLSLKIDWEKLEVAYAVRINDKMIHPNLPSRTVIAALIIKYKLNLSSNETIRQINENVYFQYFVRASGKNLEFLTPSLLRSVRERFGSREWYYFKKLLRENSSFGVFDKIFRNKGSRPKKSVPQVSITPIEEVLGQQAAIGGIDKEKRKVSRSERREEKRRKKKVKKLKTYVEYAFWTIVFAAFIYSLVQLSIEAELFKDSRLKKKKTFLQEHSFIHVEKA